jgi:hypothetical protein
MKVAQTSQSSNDEAKARTDLTDAFACQTPIRIGYSTRRNTLV